MIYRIRSPVLADERERENPSENFLLIYSGFGNSRGEKLKILCDRTIEKNSTCHSFKFVAAVRVNSVCS